MKLSGSRNVLAKRISRDDSVNPWVVEYRPCVSSTPPCRRRSPREVVGTPTDNGSVIVPVELLQEKILVLLFLKCQIRRKSHTTRFDFPDELFNELSDWRKVNQCLAVCRTLVKKTSTPPTTRKLPSFVQIVSRSPSHPSLDLREI